MNRVKEIWIFQNFKVLWEIAQIYNGLISKSSVPNLERVPDFNVLFKRFPFVPRSFF